MFGRSIHAEPASAVLIDVADARHSLASHPPHTKRVFRPQREGATIARIVALRRIPTRAMRVPARGTPLPHPSVLNSAESPVSCAPSPHAPPTLQLWRGICTQTRCAHQCDAACVSQHSMLLRARRPSYPPTMYTYEDTGSQRCCGTPVPSLWWHDDARRCACLRSNHSRSRSDPGQRHRRPRRPAVCCGRVYLHDDSCRRHMRALASLSGRGVGVRARASTSRRA